MNKLLNNPVVKYLREAREELKKVTWPTQKEITRYTGLVIGFSLALAILFGALDLGFQAGLEGLLDLTGGGSSSSSQTLPVNSQTDQTAEDISDTIQIETEGDNSGTVIINEDGEELPDGENVDGETPEEEDAQ